MNDLQKKIDTLEAAAADCDLISQLSPSKRVQASNENLSEQYLGVANDLKHPELAASERRLQLGKELVSIQRGIIARLERQRYPTEMARQLLRTLEQTLALLEQQRDQVQRRM